MHSITFILLFIGIQFSSSFVIKPKHTGSSIDVDYHVCKTPGCEKAANEIISNMNDTVDPCDDFYQFACGGFLSKRTIPGDRSQVSVFADVQDALNSQLQSLMEREVKVTDPEFIKQLKFAYDSCMDLKKIDEAGSEPLKKILDSLGGWPVVEGQQWDSSKFDWLDTTLALRKLGYSHHYILNVGVLEDLKNNKIHLVAVDQAVLGMPDRAYLLNGLDDKATAAYFNLMIKAAKKLGADEETAKEELMKALKFETSIAEYSIPNEEKRDFNKLYNIFTLKELQDLVPEIDWVKVLNGILNDPVSSNERIMVTVPDYFKKLVKLLASTDKRTIANYMMWRAVSESVSYLSKDWRDLLQDYQAAIIGSSQESPRFETCLSAVSSALHVSLGSYYVRNYFKEDSKEKANELVDYVKTEFIHMLESIDWMDEKTKLQAIDKAKAIRPFIGYPPELLDDEKISKYHENLRITNDFFDNVLSVGKWAVDKSMDELRKPSIKGDWIKHSLAAIVNAFYNPLENSIDFPAGILQKTFFTKDRPNYMNFGAIGYVIGHEITHGFDDMGRQFDKEGNNKDWWGESTDKQFRKKADCIIQQYGNYTTEIGLPLNGINTQGENIADNGGLKEAYWAYQTWMRDNSPEYKLPGLKYTPNQLFWISAANVWCAKYRPETLKLMIYSGVHSPGPFRVIGPMSNLAEFSKDFQCPLGSRMNPHEKCTVW